MEHLTPRFTAHIPIGHAQTKHALAGPLQIKRQLRQTNQRGIFPLPPNSTTCMLGRQSEPSLAIDLGGRPNPLSGNKHFVGGNLKRQRIGAGRRRIGATQVMPATWASAKRSVAGTDSMWLDRRLAATAVIG